MTLIAAALGAGLGLGATLVILGIRGTPPRQPRPRRTRDGRLALRLSVAAAAALVTLAVTGWPAGAALAAAATVAAPRLIGAGARRRAAIERTEAIARWTEMLRDTMAGAAGLEQAIAATAPLAPPPIADHIRRLALRLQRQPLVAALRALADELADPASDLVVAALILAAQREARDLGRLLGALADSTRAHAHMVERVETGRARTRTAVAIVTGTVVVFTAGMILFNRAYLQPYGTPSGQLWLLVVGGLYAAAFALLGRMAHIPTPARTLTAGHHPQAGP